MKRQKGVDEIGEYEKVAVKWDQDQGCYLEVSFDDPEFIEWQKQQYALSKARQKPRTWRK